MRRAAAAFAGVTMLTGPAWAGSDAATVLATLDKLMTARSVAVRCGRSDATAAGLFQQKYELLTERAMTALKILISDLAPPHLEKLIETHFGEIDRRVSAVIAQESCDGPRIQQALQKYDSVANNTDTELIADIQN